MNLDDAIDYARNHKAATGIAAGTVILLGLWLHHRSKTLTASDTAGTTGATVNGAGDYLVPYNTSDPAGMSNGDTSNLATAINGLTTTLGGLTFPRSTDPTTTTRPAVSAHRAHQIADANRKARAARAKKLAPPAVSAHRAHQIADANRKARAARAHEIAVANRRNRALHAKKPSATQTPTGAHSGQTATPGGATSTGTPVPVVMPPRPSWYLHRRRFPVPTNPVTTPTPIMSRRLPIVISPPPIRPAA